MVDTHFAAWLAGFFDGEGCVSIASPHARRSSCQLFVVISQSDAAPLRKIQAVYGGTLSVSTCRTGTPVHVNPYYKATKDNWRLSFNFWEVRCMLQDMLPYLQVKKNEAQLALDYVATVTNLIALRGGNHSRPRLGGAGGQMTALERAVRQQFYDKLQQLKRGASAPLPIPSTPLPQPRLL